MGKSRDSGFGIRERYNIVVPAKAGTHFDFGEEQDGSRLSPG